MRRLKPDRDAKVYRIVGKCGITLSPYTRKVCADLVRDALGTKAYNDAFLSL
jgi:hypothetical protein